MIWFIIMAILLWILSIELRFDWEKHRTEWTIEYIGKLWNGKTRDNP